MVHKQEDLNPFINFNKPSDSHINYKGHIPLQDSSVSLSDLDRKVIVLFLQDTERVFGRTWAETAQKVWFFILSSFLFPFQLGHMRILQALKVKVALLRSEAVNVLWFRKP